MSRILRALISVTDKTGVIEFARGLQEWKVEILSTGGTGKMLLEAGIPVKDVSEVTGFPEMLDGRVKTLHPAVHAGILAKRNDETHRRMLEQSKIGGIDMVVVNLYAFEQVAARSSVKFSDLIENVDIGGPAMIRSAAKNFQDVAVLTSPEDYSRILDEMKRYSGQLSPKTHWSLAQKAFACTARYDAVIAGTLASVEDAGQETVTPRREMFPETLDLRFQKLCNLRYGENPHQAAALYATSGNEKGGLARSRQLQGKELSFNNLVDLEAAWNLAQEFSEPATAIIKHTNPCGASVQRSLAASYQKAYEADPVSAYGSVLGFNRPLDGETADQIAKTFVEAIAAPGYAPEARERLAGKKNLRLIEIDNSVSRDGELHLEQVSGGMLVQEKDRHSLSAADLKPVTIRRPSEEEVASLLFAWKVAKHVKSNAIVYARGRQVAGVGAGQMSRVDSVRLGASKAVLPLQGSVMASDAFFPFPDGVEEAAKAGVAAVIQPGGSIRDQEVIAAADRLGLAMVFTGVRHFRH